MVRVHPDQLGPVDIHLRVDGDSAELALASSHPAAREALESALPRLRDQLGEAGYQLVRAEVTGQHSREGGARDGSPAAGEAQENRAQESEPEATLPVLDRRIAGRAGMLDLFA
jgi:flagellar hook-length control protein FliK